MTARFGPQRDVDVPDPGPDATEAERVTAAIETAQHYIDQGDGKRVAAEAAALKHDVHHRTEDVHDTILARHAQAESDGGESA